MRPDDLRFAKFADALAGSGFLGDLETGAGAREVAATDNSIYHLLPLAVAYPRSGEDINRIVREAARAGVPICARGGNTGTNGQSLSRGLIVDFARHMNRIISVESDETGARVRVEPGVVLDQLNAALSERGLFFPPMVSTASRATIGGMVGTDASGKGSRRYGKTSDYVEAVELVLSNGEDWTAEPMTAARAEELGATVDMVGNIHREVLRVVREQADEIARVFPEMNRGLTGYNLQKVYEEPLDRFFLGSLLAGSEGTLAVTKAVTLRAIPKPRAKALAVVRYSGFETGLRDVARLLDADPVAIEIIDDKVIGVAQSDVVWNGIETVLGDDPDALTKAISFVEFAGSAGEVENGLALLAGLAQAAPSEQIDIKIVRDLETIAGLWRLREKSVGLLARIGGGGQGIPFVEDTAVPPERLPEFVARFRGALDRYGLKYGMFGHADVGCLHVRPFIDMKDPAQAALIRPLSDEIAALTKAHGGLLWGEHGRGFRGEYSPFFFGPTLYAELQNIKRAFDPAGLLNPGKLASPPGGDAIDRIDAIPFRGTLDARIDEALKQEFDRAIACNGNGACFSWDTHDAMCPSYKATRDRAQSPKGRAALLRTWARLASAAARTGSTSSDLAAIESATAASLATCLSCKACTTSCPVNVDIPTMKSRFYERYYARRPRPRRHGLVKRLELLLAVGRRVPALVNFAAGSKPVRDVIRAFGGFVDLPRFAPAAGPLVPPVVDIRYLRSLGADEAARTVVLIEDSFTASFDGAVLAAAAAVLGHVGFRVLRLPPKPNGKALHLLGMRRGFADIARRRVAELEGLAATGVNLVGLDAATSLMFEQEYREFTGTSVRLSGLEDIILRGLDHFLPAAPPPFPGGFRLLSHCTEAALRPTAAGKWKQAFAQCGLALEPQRTGCCGMAGMFGHEAENEAISERLFDLSWRPALAKEDAVAVATGFSCRCQSARLTGKRPAHPIEIIRDRLCPTRI